MTDGPVGTDTYAPTRETAQSIVAGYTPLELAEAGIV